MPKPDPLRAPPPPAPTRPDSREIVEAIVQAAIELTKPAASMDEIAVRAGVGVASVYRYFPTRASIYAEISRRLQQRFVADLRVALARGPTDVAVAVRAVCALAVDGAGVDARLRHVLNVAVPPSWTHASALQAFAEVQAELTTWLCIHLHPVPDDLDERVFAVFAMVRGAIQVSMTFPTLAPPNARLTEHLNAAVMAVLCR